VAWPFLPFVPELPFAPELTAASTLVARLAALRPPGPLRARRLALVSVALRPPAGGPLALDQPAPSRPRPVSSQ
jgi:hypothetical protein